jgi:hypothetical protein
MAKRDWEHLEEREALEVWRRAAHLQAEGERTGDRVEPERLLVRPTDGYPVDTVRKAAIEAGIGEEYVDAALAEVRTESVLPVVSKDRTLAARFFGELLDVVTVRRIIQAPPAEVLSTILEIFRGDPYRLILSGKKGDPVDSGALVFDIEGLGSVRKPWLATEVSTSAVRQIYALLRSVDGEDRVCEVTLHGPIAWSHNTGLVHGLIVTGVSGGAFGAGTGGITAAALGGLLANPIGWIVAGGAALAGFLAGGGLGRNGYRAYCRYGIERARRAMERLLLDVAVRSEQGQAEA